MKSLSHMILAATLVAVLAGPAAANVEQMKVYKKAFPAEKTNCIYCHVSAKPKKDDGEHDLNAYGEQVKGLGELTAEKLQEIGSAADAAGGE